MIPSDVEGLIFDCDGTLVDTMPAHFRAWCETLAPYGLVLSEDRFYALAGVPTVRIVELLAAEQHVSVDAIALGREKDQHYLALGDHGGPIEPVVAIARREKGRRKLAVASGNFTELVWITLRSAGIADLFEVVVGADQVKHGKPAPDMFLLAAEKIGVAPSDCQVYEDADLGLQAAHAAGMRAVDIRPLLAPRAGQ
ncbi:MAG: HAD family hydrolase [Polyangiales bacterium]